MNKIGVNPYLDRAEPPVKNHKIANNENQSSKAADENGDELSPDERTESENTDQNIVHLKILFALLDNTPKLLLVFKSSATVVNSSNQYHHRCSIGFRSDDLGLSGGSARPSGCYLQHLGLRYVWNQSRYWVETWGIPPHFSAPLLPTPVQRNATSRPKPKLNTYRMELQVIDPNITVERHKIFETTFGQLDAPLIRLTDTRTGFYAVTDEANTIDKLTSNKAIEAFKKLNLKPIISPDLRERRSVFIRQIDYYIGSKNPEKIKEEIQRIQPWLKVSEVIKIKQDTHLLKIVTADTTIAQRILTEGFKMFNTKISARQCEQETYTHILICYKCYKFESHPTHECRSTVQVCSECLSPDHILT
ncbi:hypothetical protein FHG87_009509 [Trinorchestia longiramus]|nr:hypothetical protein FHG87_009509 [Trinorchestia longiramus]